MAKIPVGQKSSAVVDDDQAVRLNQHQWSTSGEYTFSGNWRCWVYGTRTNKWYLVDRYDRDFDIGISQQFVSDNGFDKAKEEYLSSQLVGRS